MRYEAPNANYRHILAGLILACGGLGSIGEARAALEVNVTHVGFPAVNEQGDVYRVGDWVPIIVDLSLVGMPSFDGTIRTAQLDSDGDEASDTVELHLRSETGGTQRVFLYTIPNPAYENRGFSVEVRDTDGNLVQVVANGELTYRARPDEDRTVRITHDDLLILSISRGTLGRVSDLVDPQNRATFRRQLYVAHTSPENLPELSIGLEMADYIVWDNAKPEDLTQKQLQALLLWVRQGGTLLIGASRTAGSLRLSEPLRNVLPVDIGDLTTADNLLAVRGMLLDPPRVKTEEAAPHRNEWLETPYPSPIPVAQVSVRPGAFLIEREEALNSDVLTRRFEGRGQVIFCAVALHDLFSAPCEVSRFFRRLFYLISASPDDQQVESVSLFNEIVGAVGFAASGSLYLLIAGLFSVLYVVIATFGLWGYLRRRGWENHSWTAFAAAGLLASTLSIFAVGAVRGIGDRLHQIAIVDAAADSREALATGYFGVKTPIDKEIDVWLPSDWQGALEPEASDNSIRPLPPGAGLNESQTRFADPAKYNLAPGSAVADDVRVRATLKRFEGRWQGTLGGDIGGAIRVRDREVLDGSSIANGLGFDLRDCLLLVPAIDPGAVAGRSASDTNFRDSHITAYELGTIAAGATIDVVTAATRFDRNGKKIDPPKLQALHGTWSSAFRSLFEGFGAMQERSTLGQEQKALMLLSTIHEFNPAQHGGNMQAVFGPRTWSQDRMRQLDITDQLTAGTPMRGDQPGAPGAAVLIGFADDPGPMRLFIRGGERDFRVLEPEEDYSWSMWRVRIPIVRLDREIPEEQESEPATQ